MDKSVGQKLSAQPRFSASEDEKLINFVSANVILWKLNDPDFKNSSLKDKKWSEVGQILHKTGENCKIRWKSIRDNFKRKRKDEPPGADTQPRKKRANYWKRLDFLNDSHEKHPSVKNCSGEELRETTDENEQSAFIEEQSADVEQFAEKHCLTNFYEVDSARSKKKVKQSATNHGGNHSTNLIKSVKKILLPEIRKEEEIDLFFKAMAATVKQFTQADKAEAKMKIFNIVSNIEMRSVESRPNFNYICSNSNLSMDSTSSVSSYTPSVSENP